jgi:hypothetical protein
MTISAQVLRHNAMMGRCRKPPMDQKEMLDLAKELLFRKGVDGLTSFISVEPYSRVKVEVQGNSGGGGNGHNSGRGGNGHNSGGGGNGQSGGSGASFVEGAGKSYDELSCEQKVRKCCKAHNTDKGCPKPANKCRFRYWCTYVDEAKKRVCWSKDHNLRGHK